MKLEGKRDLIARTLKVGKNRIVFNNARLNEIKEAITKQDIKGLAESGAIHLKEPKGRKTKKQRNTRRRAGSIKKKVKKSKRTYITITRKLRSYLFHLRKIGSISREDYLTLRKEIRTSAFRSLTHMKERISQLSPETQGGKNAKDTKKKNKRKKN